MATQKTGRKVLGVSITEKRKNGGAKKLPNIQKTSKTGKAGKKSLLVLTSKPIKRRKGAEARGLQTRVKPEKKASLNLEQG